MSFKGLESSSIFFIYLIDIMTVVFLFLGLQVLFTCSRSLKSHVFKEIDALIWRPFRVMTGASVASVRMRRGGLLSPSGVATVVWRKS